MMMTEMGEIEKEEEGSGLGIASIDGEPSQPFTGQWSMIKWSVLGLTLVPT